MPKTTTMRKVSSQTRHQLEWFPNIVFSSLVCSHSPANFQPSTLPKRDSQNSKRSGYSCYGAHLHGFRWSQILHRTGRGFRTCSQEPPIALTGDPKRNHDAPRRSTSQIHSDLFWSVARGGHHLDGLEMSHQMPDLGYKFLLTVLIWVWMYNRLLDFDKIRLMYCYFC